MDYMVTADLHLTTYYGRFKTRLEIEYKYLILNKLLTGDDETRKWWATFHQVALTLKHNVKDELKLKELQYRLTNGEDPILVTTEIISRLGFQDSEINRLYIKIINF